MRILLPLLICFLLGVSCESKKPDYQKMIQGNWEVQIQNHWEDTIAVRLFIIDNIVHYGDFQRNDFFQLKDDRAVSDILLKDSNINRNVDLFKIISVSNDRLVIVTKSQYFSDQFHCEKNDTLRFVKVQKKNDIEVKRIAFYSTGCNGCCPSFLMEVNKDDSVKFNGFSCAAKSYYWRGEASPGFWEFLTEKTKYIDFSNWNEKYDAGWTDDQTCCLVFDTNQGLYKVSIYGNDKEPRAIRDIIEYVFSNYGSFDLTKTDSTKIKFTHEEQIEELGQIFPQIISY